MIETVKTSYQKAKTKQIILLKFFFWLKLVQERLDIKIKNYESFEEVFLEVLNKKGWWKRLNEKHAP